MTIGETAGSQEASSFWLGWEAHGFPSERPPPLGPAEAESHRLPCEAPGMALEDNPPAEALPSNRSDCVPVHHRFAAPYQRRSATRHHTASTMPNGHAP